ncbi:MAG: glycosyltransferase family 4 protein [Phycisphaerae bacterium]
MIHLLAINEFFHPDVCASSAVWTDHLPRIARLRPDWRFTVLTGNRAWDRPDVVHPERARFDGVDIIRVPRPAVGRGLLRRGVGFAAFHLGALRAGWRLPRPDVIVATTAPPLGGPLGVLLARRFRCPLIYKVYDLYPDCATALGVLRPGGGLADLWAALDTAAMRRSAAVVAISRGTANRIARQRNIEPQQIQLIRDGFDRERVRPVPHRENAFRRQQGLEGKFVVQFAGNMGRSHPLETILDAARGLRGDERMVFQFIGVGPGRSVVESARRELGSRVQLLPYQPAERLSDVLSAADAALISQADGVAEASLPYKFYSILAAGRPVVYVGPQSSEIVAYINDFRCGVHVAQSDAAGLADALSRLANDETKRSNMGARARALFENEFTSDRAVRDWIALIERVVQKSVPRT